jgi:Tol biopolymer transport system component
MNKTAARLLALTLFVTPAVAFAEREPVLRQVDIPHNYYWREMCIPQLTSGPSALAWSPDGHSLVYAMRGSLWRQEIGTDTAIQLTAGPGYDYQPDWSPDGSRIAFARYADDAIELWVLDVASGETRQLTNNSGVNLEPRWSPDGSRIAFVSTFATGRFRIFTANMTGAFSPVQFSPERQSATPRYYYSPFDHEISPSWSPDGNELLYVSNPETGYGTGSLWRRAVAGGDPVLVREEETSWRARPDWGPDGRRVIWASYAGRQWHQLWITTSAGGGYPLPLSYGDFDATAARWSPDGRQIAYISNEAGDGRIWIMDVPGGAQRALEPAMRDCRQRMGTLDLEIVDAEGNALPARVSITGSDGHAYAPQTAWIHADDNFDRADRSEETHYFHTSGRASLTLPAGVATITIWHGLEHAVEQRTIEVAGGETGALRVALSPLALPALAGWQSGDVHVHMNYGGVYRHTTDTMIAQAAAEDLAVVFDTIVNKEQRIPGIGDFASGPSAASNQDVLLVPAQEYHTSFWGHLGLLGLTDHYLLPDFSAYPNTGAASLYPDNPAIADLAHEQGALVGYVHPFDPLGEPNSYSTHEVAVDAALGNIDYYEVVGFADFHTSAAIWYRLLNLGFRIAAAGGTDAMANYASLRGPVGLNRTYVLPGESDGSLVGRRDAWIEGLRAGRSVATNGPLLSFTVEGQGPGGEIALPEGGGTLRWTAAMTSIAQVDHVEIVRNGEVVATVPLAADGRSASGSGQITIDSGGWIVLRAWSSEDRPEILDLYPYATTSPVYVQVARAAQRSPQDVQYMLDWLDLIEGAAQGGDYNSDAERETVMGNIARARAIYEAIR